METVTDSQQRQRALLKFPNEIDDVPLSGYTEALARLSCDLGSVNI